MFPRLYRRRFKPTKSSAWSSYSRFLSSTPSPSDNDGGGEKTKDAKAFADSSLRGVGQVLFLNSPTSGMMILGGLAVGDPYLSVLAATGAATATASAYGSGLDKSALRDGLWGYNGCLVGCAAAVFVNPIPVAASAATTAGAISAGLATTLVGSAATPFVAAALKPALGSVPQFTLAFNLVTLSTLLRTRPLLPPPIEAGTSEVTAETAAASMPGFSDAILYGPLKGISQVFVVESSLTGAAILGGIAMYSRGLAGHTLMGSTIGATTGLLLGADVSAVSIGLWGFNSALTSLGIGVFYVHSPQVVALSAGGAAATAAVFGAMSTAFGTYGSPCLTLPFCFVMSGCYLMADTMPGLTLAQAPHSPEKNS